MTDFKKLKIEENLKNSSCPPYWKVAAIQDGCQISVKLSGGTKEKG
jgi:hypothetical protein